MSSHISHTHRSALLDTDASSNSNEDGGCTCTRARNGRAPPDEMSSSGSAYSHLAFSSLFLPAPILSALTSLSYHHPSPIQLHSIPPALHGLDLIAQAQSGTGKSLVFAVLALTHALRRPSPPRIGLCALVLLPTRELGVQVEGVVRSLAETVGGVRVESVMGGKGGVREDRERLSGCDVLVATVGRLRHLLDEDLVRAEQLTLLVLDEADALLAPSSSSFADVNAIIGALPAFPQRQTALFSATWPTSVMGRAREVTSDAQAIMLDSQKPHTTIKHFVLFVDVPTDPSPSAPAHAPLSGLPPSLRDGGGALVDAVYDGKFAALLQLLSSFPFHQCLIFARSATHAGLLPHSLTVHGYPALPLSSALDPAVRAATMASFRSLHMRILVTSDLLSRGFDHPTVNLIVHWDDAYDPAAFLHRGGRTGRWGRRGRTVWLVERGGEQRVRAMERVAGIEVEELAVRDGRVVLEGRDDAYEKDLQRQTRQLKGSAEQSWALDKYDAARKGALEEMDEADRAREPSVAYRPPPPDTDGEDSSEESTAEDEKVPIEEVKAGRREGVIGPSPVASFCPFDPVRGGAAALFPAAFPLDILHMSDHARRAAQQFYQSYPIH